MSVPFRRMRAMTARSSVWYGFSNEVTGSASRGDEWILGRTPARRTLSACGAIAALLLAAPLLSAAQAPGALRIGIPALRPRRYTVSVNFPHPSSRGWALLFARLILGLIFFMAGWYKVFQLTPAGHVQKWFLPFHDTFLPTWSLWAVGLAIPFVELIAGTLLLLGFRVHGALISLGLVLVVVSFGHLLKAPLYPFHEHVFPRLALLLFLLAMPRADDHLSLDHFLHSRSSTAGGGKNAV